ncbi:MULTISPECIES: hypothetical protein [Sphingobium]|uniref:Uncharacterized protein n=1 Tax=Sphingobium fuliginis (strain ATCC 27551) TaxID=336203 RepID=A0ABQ1EQS8_SPHSA|nr:MULTISPECIES: hypothetical protein [Sphingobium]RYM00606.1 hypothetical protein EWH10_00630 [Sphingobium fuliginis]WDA38081.1 hypothetical protein PO876_07920 [Sphingobium sp. YC-XJ3]GFZ82242.1 hypothetical protein GCM10019071_08650 [Sphingobium fuliginis]
MTCQFPPLPTTAQQIRADGWSPARQRAFLETLAATGIILSACEAARISPRSAYALRIRRDGAAFRLGWDAAILIARARLADDLLARALTGHEEVIRKDMDAGEITRHRHDNRLAMSMLSCLDRMADSPPQGSDAALARVVAQDFAAYLDMLCPEDQAQPDRPDAAPPPMAADADHAALPDHAAPEDAPAIEQAAAALSPGASAALFVAARLALGEGGKAPLFALDGRCELRPIPAAPPVDRASFPPEEAAARLRGIWWDEERDGWRTDYPAPPGFDGEESDALYDIDAYERDLTMAEEQALALRAEAERRPYEHAAARARDAFFGFAALAGAG